MSDPSHRFLSCVLSAPQSSAIFLFPLPHNHPQALPALSELPPHCALRSHPTPRPQLFPDAQSPAPFSQLHYCPAHPCPHCYISMWVWPLQDGASSTWFCVRVSVNSRFTSYLVPSTKGAFWSPCTPLLLWVSLLHQSLRHIPHLSSHQFF